MLSLVFWGEILHELDGREVKSLLQPDKTRGKADYCICNGNGILGGVQPGVALERLFDSGIDVVVTGDKALSRPSSRELHGGGLPVIRPLNFPDPAIGKGVYKLESNQGPFWLVSLCTSSDRKPMEDPFSAFDNWFKTRGNHTPIFTMIHGNDLAVKEAFFWKYARCEPVIHCFGTGLGIGSRNVRVSNGRLFIPDLGTVSAENSIAGWAPELWWKHHRNHLPQGFLASTAPLKAEGCRVTVGENFRLTAWDWVDFPRNEPK